MSVPLRSESTIEPVRALPLRGSKAAHTGLSRSRRSANKVTPAKRPAFTTVQALPKATRPLWLKGLIGLQTLSIGLALGTVGVTLALYGLIVQADRQLNTATTELRQLQRQEQQLTAAKAVLQHHLAQAAVDSQVELPEQPVIFLDPEVAPADASKDSDGPSESIPPGPAAAPSPFSIPIPMGY